MNNNNHYRTRKVIRGLPMGEAWDLIDDLVEAYYSDNPPPVDNLCSDCGENIRLQGYQICFECWEALTEQEDYEGHIEEVSI